MESKEPIEFLSLLTEKIMRLDVIGGIPSITQEDISHAVARADLLDRERRLVRAKYLLSTDECRPLAVDLYIEIMDRHKGWHKSNGHRPGLLMDLAKLAVFESVSPHRCPWCNGRGEAKIESKIIACDLCGGSGRKPPSDNERAKIIGVDFYKWRLKYRVFQDILDDWERRAANRLIPELSQLLACA